MLQDQPGDVGGSHLVVLVQLAAESHCQVSSCTRSIAAGKHVLPVLKGAASTFAYVHVLEARLYAAKTAK